LPFAGSGALGAWIAGKTLVDAQRVRDWVLVKAEVVPGSFGAKPGGPGSGHLAYAVGGKRYEGRRLALGGLGASDDIDEWRTGMAETLASAREAGRGISIWVDPDNPAESVFDREPPWHRAILGGMLAFSLGIAGLIALRGASALATGRETAGSRPNGTTGAGFLWIFALLWNGFAFLMAWLVLPDILASREWAGLLILLFPFVGAFVVWGAMGATVTAVEARVARSPGPRPPPGKPSKNRGPVAAPRPASDS
jgi:hypothetical protein